MDRINVKIATEADAETVADISKSTFYHTFHADNTEQDMQLFIQENFALSIVRNELRDLANTFLLAYAGAELVGYAKLTEKNCPEGIDCKKSVEIARIYSTAGKVGVGVGRALMNECLALAKRNNKQIIWLGVWERNERAINFYKKWGFEKFGEHTFMLGNDAQNDWLMKKVL
jgi:diamine N-acetyltransferase